MNSLRVYFTVFITLIVTTVTAQKINVDYLSGPICIKTPVTIPFTVSGRFGTDNLFRVQIRNAYNSQLVYTSEGVVASPARVQIPTDLPYYYDSGRYQVRIISSNPYAESAWTNLPAVQETAVVTMAPLSFSMVNPNQAVTLRYVVQGSSPVSVTLTDGTRHELEGCCNNQFENYGLIYPEKTAAYAIASVRNVCGVGKGQGSSMLTVNPIATKTMSVTPSRICSGNYIYVAYSKSGGAFAADNKFKVRLITYNPFAYDQPGGKYYDFDGEESNGTVRAFIPDSFVGGYSFYVQVLTTNPVTVSDPSTGGVSINPPATAELVTASPVINYGQQQTLAVQVTGRGPYQVVLNDSLQIPIDDYSEGSGFGSIQVKPRQTTTYRITGFQTTCGLSPAKASSTIVTVRPGVAIDSLPGSGFTRGPVCEGALLKLPVSMNFAPQAATRFFVDFRYQEKTLASAPATLENGKVLALVVPVLPTDTSNFNGIRQYSVRIRTAAPETEGGAELNQVLVVVRKPNPIFATYTRQITLDKPGLAAVTIRNLGGGPTEINFSNGTVLSSSCFYCDEVSTGLFASQTTTFRINYAQNACGRIDNPPTEAKVTVKSASPVGIEIDSVQQNRCNSDSILVYFRTKGTFDAGNEFRIQSASSSLGEGWGWTEGLVVGRGTRSPIRIKLGEDSKIRINAMSPVVVSNEFRVAVNQKPTADLKAPDGINHYHLYGSEPNTIPAGSSVTLDVNYLRGTGPFRTVYTDGKTDFVNPSGTSVVVKPVGPTTYRLKAIANACGQGEVNTRGVTFVPMPYRIEVAVRPSSDPYYFSFCTGSSWSLPFITNPTAPAGTVFTLQLASRKDSLFTDIATTKTPWMLIPVPASLTAGDYYLRIIDKSTGARTASLPVQVLQPPTATLLPVEPVSATLSPGNSASLRVNLTGSSPWQVFFSDKAWASFYGSPGVREIQPQSGRTYTLQTVTNVCGYGTASGEATVWVKPQLRLALDSNGGAVCVGSSAAFQVLTSGDFPPNTSLGFSLVNTESMTETNLGTNAIGVTRVSLKLPADLPPGSYLARVTASDGTQASSQPFTVSVPPAYTLMGSTTINAGQSTYLTLRRTTPAGGTDIVRYVLSDGYQETVVVDGARAFIQVTPTETTTYTLATLTNGCGVGQGTGSAVVVVNPLQEKMVSVTNMRAGQLCSGSSFSVTYSSTGAFSASNKFTVQLSDSTGGNFQSLPTTGTVSPLVVIIPTTTPVGFGYRLRIVASDPNTASGASPYAYRVATGATAAFDSTTYYLRPNTTVQLKVRFTGDGPWYYTISSNQNSSVFYATKNPAIVDLRPIQPTTYQLINVSNGCGMGRVVDPSTARVELVTATEAGELPEVTFYPNPASDRIWVNLKNIPKPVNLSLIDLNGRVLKEVLARQDITELSINDLSNSSLFLRIQTNETSQPLMYHIIRHP
ncbi:T9SS type A sorting domain-containing protein [Spirosoma linguale]|uniref:Secretion system C-terminal sorting domain-containing protein n=1 Tax=Spirosoma linguale (strain ATCC 33905 / DSM 74 / LMG 10896 / Claus 1) TaxID=504472 RepID=D2QQ73_SPILD|nr:hypothetical protein Slin_3498 [Spirosoma linguale DSM 74]